MTQTSYIVTDEQIDALRAEAGAAGDYTLVATCDRARDVLAPWDDTPRFARVPSREIHNRTRRLTVEQARARCARVIAEAAARK